MGLQYRSTTCTLTGLTISVTEPSPPRMLSSGQTLELLEPMSLRPLGKRVEEPARCRNRGFRVRLAFFADRYACLDGCALRVLWCRKRKTGHYSTAASADLQHLGDGYSISGRERRDGNASRERHLPHRPQTARGTTLFTGLPSGAYTVTPSHIGYTSAPTA